MRAVNECLPPEQALAAVLDRLLCAAPSPCGQRVVLTAPDAGDQHHPEHDVLSLMPASGPLERFRAGRSGPVVAVDAGAVTLGETSKGLLVAIRGAIVRQQDGRCNLTRARSGVLHLPHEPRAQMDVLHAIGTALGQPGFFVTLEGDRPTALKRGSATRASHYTDRVRTYIERVLQQAAVTMIQDGVVLLDGALTMRSHDTPDVWWRALARAASAQGNSIVAISKRSNLLVDGRAVRFALDDAPATVGFRDLTAAMRAASKNDPRAERSLGNVFAARLSALGHSFRMDMVPARGLSHADVLNQFWTSCQLRQGYPELLVRAHAMTAYSRVEIIGLQASVCARWNLVVRPEPSMNGIFAPFGGRYK